MADIRNTCLGRITQGTCNMIRIDEIWLSTQPMDMRAGMDTTMAQVEPLATSNRIVLTCSVINVAIA